MRRRASPSRWCAPSCRWFASRDLYVGSVRGRLGVAATRRVLLAAFAWAGQGEFTCERDGTYVLRVEAGAQQAGGELAKVEFSWNGTPVHVSEVSAPVDRMEFYEFKMQATAGKHRFSAAFINDYYNPGASDPRDRDRNLAIRALEVVGPVDASRTVRQRRAIASWSFCRARTGRHGMRSARFWISFATRAFRRPVQADELERLVGLAGTVLDSGSPFEEAIQVAITAVLVSPHFLFRVEDDHASGTEGRSAS
jgi:hypothetical protein